MLRVERSLWSRGISHVAGIDEAGRGPLAGPVVAAAVIMPRGFYLPGVDDSKRLTAAVRCSLAGRIRDTALAVGVGVVDHETIDRVNILNATFEAMHLAVENLSIQPDFLLIDGNRYREGRGTRGEATPFTTIVGGDASCFSIAAASIIAKVTRDRMMEEFDALYPLYGFVRHKGYATPQHRAAILRHGLCAIHRRSFTRRLIAELFDDRPVDICDREAG